MFLLMPKTHSQFQIHYANRKRAVLGYYCNSKQLNFGLLNGETVGCGTHDWR